MDPLRPPWDEMVLVGRVARPHGLRGHVVVNAETDFPETRFAPGATCWRDTASGPERLVVSALRFQSGRPVIGFEGYDTIEAVEPLVGQELRIPETELQPLPEGVYYHHQLIGCRVETVSGAPVGAVTRVEGGTGMSLLVVDGAQGEVLIPLVPDICATVDVDARRIVIEPPDGLLELNVPDESRAGRRRRDHR